MHVSVLNFKKNEVEISNKRFYEFGYFKYWNTLRLTTKIFNKKYIKRITTILSKDSRYVI